MLPRRALAALAASLLAATAADAQCFAQLPDGAVSGITMPRGIRSFRGLPFAKPPLGSRRWAPPVENDPYGQDVLAAETWPPSCVQPGGGGGGAMRGNESCLFLNVWSPPEAVCSPARPCAVAFWIYGGGYKAGQAARNGAALASAASTRNQAVNSLP